MSWHDVIGIILAAYLLWRWWELRRSRDRARKTAELHFGVILRLDEQIRDLESDLRACRATSKAWEKHATQNAAKLTELLADNENRST